MVIWRKVWRSPKSVWFILWGIVNICTDFHDSQPSCWDILVWTNWLTDRHCHPSSHANDLLDLNPFSPSWAQVIHNSSPALSVWDAFYSSIQVYLFCKEHLSTQNPDIVDSLLLFPWSLLSEWGNGPPSFTRAPLAHTFPQQAFIATIAAWAENCPPYIAVFFKLCLFPSPTAKIKGWALGDSHASIVAKRSYLLRFATEEGTCNVKWPRLSVLLKSELFWQQIVHCWDRACDGFTAETWDLRPTWASGEKGIRLESLSLSFSTPAACVCTALGLEGPRRTRGLKGHWHYCRPPCPSHSAERWKKESWKWCVRNNKNGLICVLQ